MNHKAEQAQMFGVLSLFLGILCGIPAIILALMALSEIQRTGEEGTSRANAGLLLGILSFAWVVAYYYLFIAR